MCHCTHSPAVEVVVNLSEGDSSTGGVDNEPEKVELVVDRDPEDCLEIEGVELLDQPLGEGKEGRGGEGGREGRGGEGWEGRGGEGRGGEGR